MSGLEFMNQDGEWEKFPNDEQLALQTESDAFLDALKVRIICHLCNEPAPTEKIIFFKEGQAVSWSCDKCHAVSIR